MLWEKLLMVEQKSAFANFKMISQLPLCSRIVNDLLQLQSFWNPQYVLVFVISAETKKTFWSLQSCLTWFITKVTWSLYFWAPLKQSQKWWPEKSVLHFIFHCLKCLWHKQQHFIHSCTSLNIYNNKIELERCTKTYWLWGLINWVVFELAPSYFKLHITKDGEQN